MSIEEISVNFIEGSVSGSFTDCSSDDVADALERIVRELRESPNVPYVVLGQGGTFVGSF